MVARFLILKCADFLERGCDESFFIWDEEEG